MTPLDWFALGMAAGAILLPAAGYLIALAETPPELPPAIPRGPAISADERRRILLAQARLSADVAEIERVLTAEETREVDQWVGLA